MSMGPPVIPEIAKAYENDPRTKLALQMMQNGSSTAPVAGGDWAWADGIARVLQGAAGGFFNRRQMRQYGNDEQDLLKQRGKDIPEGIAALLGPDRPQGGMRPPYSTPGIWDGINVNVDQIRQQLGQMGQGWMRSMPGAIPGMRPFSPNPTGLFSSGGHDGNVGVPNTPDTQYYTQQPTASPGGITEARYPVAKPQGVASLTDPLGGRGRISSGYGPRRAPTKGASTYHQGVDMAAPAGTPVQAVQDGVVSVRTGGKGGNEVIIRHPDGTSTGYSHLSKFNVQSGQTVRAGQVIGAVGSTGVATGPHLHLSARDRQGRRINPATLKLSVGPIVPPTTGNVGQEPPRRQASASPVVATGQAVTAQAPAQFDPIQLPEVPAALARPEAPEAEPATTSPIMLQAYRMLRRGNRYEANDAQRLLEAGLKEQGQFNESAATRRQHLKDMGFNSDLSMYAADRGARVDSALQARNAYNNNEQQYQNQYKLGERQFGQTLTRDQIQHVYEMEKAGFDRQTSIMITGMNNDAAWKRQAAEIDASKATAEEKAEARRTAFFNTATGAKIYEASMSRVQDAGTLNDQLSEFEMLNGRTSTGGLINNIPVVAGARRIGSADVQRMEAITQDMSIKLSALLKGAVSDKEGERIIKSLPSVLNAREANARTIASVRRAVARVNDYETQKLEAISQGRQVDFARDWSAYVNSVSVDNNMTYSEWKASRPQYDQQGRRVNNQRVSNGSWFDRN